MAEALTAEAAELEQMGRAGAAQVAREHDARDGSQETRRSLFIAGQAAPARTQRIGPCLSLMPLPRREPNRRQPACTAMSQTSSPNVLVVIVNYRTAGLTIDCLRSLENEVRAAEV